LQVVDAASPERDAQDAAVEAVLEEIGAAGVPRIRVLNKADLAGLAPGVERDGCGTITSVRTSALTGAGCADLKAALRERFARPAAPADDVESAREGSRASA
jgi:GTP-binding protein HflX